VSITDKEQCPMNQNVLNKLCRWSLTEVAVLAPTSSQCHAHWCPSFYGHDHYLLKGSAPPYWSCEGSGREVWLHWSAGCGSSRAEYEKYDEAAKRKHDNTRNTTR
jgi:hypothetical protein